LKTLLNREENERSQTETIEITFVIVNRFECV
jgi:hypothetical protein